MSALDDEMRVVPQFDVYDFSDGIDWEQTDRDNSWLLYFHALMVVGCLAEEAERTGNRAFAERGSEIAESWIQWNGEAPYAWDDHAVAYRTTNLLHLERACRSLSVELPDGFDSALQQHGEWLAREKNFAAHNHGLMAAMALFHLGAWRPDLPRAEVWREKAVERIRTRIREDVSPQGVHLESSAFYHYFFLYLVDAAQRLLREHGVEVETETVEKMKRHLALLVRPDGTLPRTGDTGGKKLTEDFGHPWISYALGRTGERPETDWAVCPTSGAAVFRDGWDKDSTHVAFQCGFGRRAHKHADDLGFVLYAGTDIFVGPGVFGYGDTRERAYVCSAQAHNTVTVDGRGYAVIPENIGKARIVGYGKRHVVGEHTMYGPRLRRTLVLVSPATVLLMDEIESEESHSVEQIFNLAPGAEILSLDDNAMRAVVGGKEVVVQQRRPSTVRSFYGQEEPMRGFVSLRHGQLTPIRQVEFQSRCTPGKTTAFVTMISIR